MAIVTVDFVKDYFNITGSELDTRIAFFIPIVEANYLAIRNAPFDVEAGESDESLEEYTVYPANSEEVAAQMVMYKIKSTSSVVVTGTAVVAGKEVKSESWGDHSISYIESLVFSSELRFNYPVNIVSQIKRYMTFTEA